ncbi:MAG: hypothetical protein IPJ74_15600 [Saprospiraceae bacterium]|nr:hypothetical protein [Saprospiraceae bacterium]
MPSSQITTITFFRYEGARQRWWAFKQMGLAPALLKEVPGLQFGKMLGSGGRNGFSVLPNLSVYALLCVWEEESMAQDFFIHHPLFQSYEQKSVEQWMVFMRTTMVHGQWDGVEPFQITENFNENQLVGVITRASIRTRHLWRFWRFVPAVSRSVGNREGLLFSIGIGELPIVQQATFSLWENSKLMKAYAYQSQHHKEVVRRTRALGWYSEELFARFLPYATRGSWQGENPLAAFFSISTPIYPADQA